MLIRRWLEKGRCPTCSDSEPKFKGQAAVDVFLYVALIKEQCMKVRKTNDLRIPQTTEVQTVAASGLVRLYDEKAHARACCSY